MSRLRDAARDWLRARGYVWFRKPVLPWGLDLETDLRRSFDITRAACVIDVGAPKKDLRVWLRYDAAQRPAITGLRRVSRPSARVYVGAASMPRVRGGLGINIVSTPLGVLVDREATRRNVGGELLCSVW